MKIADRIRMARRRAGLSQCRLAKQVGVVRSAVAQWERLGGPRPTSENMAKLACCCGVSYEWLATGRGQMVLSEDSEVMPVEIEFHLYAQCELERRLLTTFRSLQYPGNRGLVELLEALASGDNSSFDEPSGVSFNRPVALSHKIAGAA
ncbi:helix-turn-helix domain-containing protein [Marilutibacter alkalisoli]|uniref:Helix-turn-helix domain-containing protein n=1 Tax=Marilutibacter alkalisoli TaxID=2591633 RepID=A0A514BNQ5_9GAMM|nr:helix-turn-helix domain-containing protein [Lysobacter alkalisoli]QDH69024.1 helix-turn-helix domain-containing protein [Lysobacter alkalisoli]